MDQIVTFRPQVTVARRELEVGFKRVTHKFEKSEVWKTWIGKFGKHGLGSLENMDWEVRITLR